MDLAAVTFLDLGFRGRCSLGAGVSQNGKMTLRSWFISNSMCFHSLKRDASICRRGYKVALLLGCLP